MSLDFRFGVISDLHIAKDHTIWDHPSRFHLVEISIAAFEQALAHFEQAKIDFLLIPGDLTQHGEPDNHKWLQERLSQLPFPVYVIPGNHDVPVLYPDHQSIGWSDFPSYYRKFGYDNTDQLYYTCQLLPGIRLIALNSNNFNQEGKQIGIVDDEQLKWLEQVLHHYQDELILVMIHHNIIEHLPDQSTHPLGIRYMLSNAPQLRQILIKAGVELVFTGHLHVQDIAYQDGLYDITTGSLVSYPHPYRILQLHWDTFGRPALSIQSYRVDSVPNFPDLSHRSREWMGDRSFPFISKLFTHPPMSIPEEEIKTWAPQLRYFWADIAKGDHIFELPDLPPSVKSFFTRCSALSPEGTPTLIDNHTTLLLNGKI